MAALSQFWILDFKFWIMKVLTVGSFDNSKVTTINHNGITANWFVAWLTENGCIPPSQKLRNFTLSFLFIKLLYSINTENHT